MNQIFRFALYAGFFVVFSIPAHSFAEESKFCSDSRVIGEWHNSSGGRLLFTENIFKLVNAGCEFQYEACKGEITATPTSNNYANCGARSTFQYSITGDILKFGNIEYYR